MTTYTLDDLYALKIEGGCIDDITVTSPSQEPERRLHTWTVKLAWSDGQYGGGEFKGEGATASEAIHRCGTAFAKFAVERMQRHAPNFGWLGPKLGGEILARLESQLQQWSDGTRTVSAVDDEGNE